MRVLMVCLGNICRSPLAEGILKKKLNEKGLDWKVDSAGTGSWHIGEPPHAGSQEVAKKNGFDISSLRARQFKQADFNQFDLILAMDSNNYKDILSLSNRKNDESKVKLILNYSTPGMNKAVPDPYFTGNFDEVYELLDHACDQLLEKETINS